MTQPQRLLHTMIDPRSRRRTDQLCAIDPTAALPSRGDSQPGARRPGIRDQPRRNSIISVGRGRSAVSGASPGGTDSP
jgi:hypothetical protein